MLHRRKKRDVGSVSKVKGSIKDHKKTATREEEMCMAAWK